jgi:hypothetical protein
MIRFISSLRGAKATSNPDLAIELDCFASLRFRSQ